MHLHGSGTVAKKVEAVRQAITNLVEAQVPRSGSRKLERER